MGYAHWLLPLSWLGICGEPFLGLRIQLPRHSRRRQGVERCEDIGVRNRFDQERLALDPLPFFGVLKAVGPERFQSSGRRIAINTEALPANHPHGAEVQRIIAICLSIVSENGAGGFLRFQRVEEFGPDLQTSGDRIQTQLGWRRNLFSQNHILLEITWCHRIAHVRFD